MFFEKKVLHIVPHLDFGGVEKHMEIISSFSGYSKYKHVFLVIGKGGTAEDKIKNNNSEVICLNLNVNVPNFLNIVWTFIYIQNIKPLIVHTHGGQANFPGIIAAFLSKVPVRISEEVGISVHSKIGKIGFFFVYKLSHSIIAVSDAVKNNLKIQGLVNINKIKRIYNPVLFSEQNRKIRMGSDPFKIGFVGRLVCEKNPIGLVRAAIILKDKYPNFILKIIGDGPQKEKLIQIIQKFNLSKNIELLGFHPNPEELLLDCDFYIQPSIAEGFGLAICEAMGLGLPVIVTANGGMLEIVDHGKTGWIIENPSPENLAEAMYLFIKIGRWKLFEMGISAKKSVIQRFTPELYLTELEILYQELTNRKFAG